MMRLCSSLAAALIATTGAAAVSTQPASPTATSTQCCTCQPLPTWPCATSPYLSSNNSVYSINTNTGTGATLQSTIGSLSSGNLLASIGYNVQDSYIYGATSTNPANLVRLGSNGQLQNLTTLPAADSYYGWSSGDVDLSGHLWLFSAQSTWAQVSLRAADFGAVISYGTTALAPTYIFDWVYLPAGGAAMWSVDVVDGTKVVLVRFDQTNHTWTTAATYRLVTGNKATTFTAIWAVSATAFQALDTMTNQLWQFSINGVAPVLIKNGLLSSYSRADGARCLLGLDSSTSPAVSSTTQSTQCCTCSCNTPVIPDVKFLNWTTYEANGVNLGGWLAKEKTHDPIWWNAIGGADAEDEWTLCKILGSKCGPTLESRYASFINNATIDKLASVGVNTLRIPTTYAAWIRVPGSQFYTGNQINYLRAVSNYAIDKYGMHIIVGLHSLPGGVNNLDIGEAYQHDDWFFNATNLQYTYAAVDGVLNFISTSGRMGSFTFAPINEASDNLAGFGSPNGLSTRAADYVNTYIKGCLQKIANIDKRIPLMLQDNFKGADFWAPFYNASTNLVIDSHVYYFAAAGTYANYINPAICGQGAYLGQQKKFPVFVGEWSLQTAFNNTYAGRETIFNTQRYAWQKYVSGGAFWTAQSYANGKVDGQGTVRDYWSYIDLIDAGVIKRPSTQAYC